MGPLFRKLGVRNRYYGPTEYGVLLPTVVTVRIIISNTRGFINFKGLGPLEVFSRLVARSELRKRAKPFTENVAHKINIQSHDAIVNACNVVYNDTYTFLLLQLLLCSLSLLCW
jgi:hypothetical protein